MFENLKRENMKIQHCVDLLLFVKHMYIRVRTNDLLLKWK